MCMLEDLANLGAEFQAKCLPIDRFCSQAAGFVIPIVKMSFQCYVFGIRWINGNDFACFFFF